MKTKIAYEEVAGMLNQWYVMIKRHEVSQAVSIKCDIEHQFAEYGRKSRSASLF
nr:hypothetical protein [Bacillus licheniformis]